MILHKNCLAFDIHQIIVLTTLKNNKYISNLRQKAKKISIENKLKAEKHKGIHLLNKYLNNFIAKPLLELVIVGPICYLLNRNLFSQERLVMQSRRKFLSMCFQPFVIILYFSIKVTLQHLQMLFFSVFLYRPIIIKMKISSFLLTFLGGL